MNFPFIIFNSRWDVYGSYFLRSLYINFVMDSLPFICRSAKPPSLRSMLPTVSGVAAGKFECKCYDEGIWFHSRLSARVRNIDFVGGDDDAVDATGKYTTPTSRTLWSPGNTVSPLLPSWSTINVHDSIRSDMFHFRGGGFLLTHFLSCVFDWFL